MSGPEASSGDDLDARVLREISKERKMSWGTTTITTLDGEDGLMAHVKDVPRKSLHASIKRLQAAGKVHAYGRKYFHFYPAN